MKKYILVIILLISVTFALCFSYQILDQQNKTKLNIKSDEDSLIYINGKQITNQPIYLNSGKYLISSSKKGFLEYRKIYDINGNNKNISIQLIQKPDEYISTMLLHGDKKEVTDKYPIISKLPFDNISYKINYSSDSTLKSTTINIEAMEGYKQYAINKIIEWGYNPSDYNIQFIKYNNPFKI